MNQSAWMILFHSDLQLLSWTINRSFIGLIWIRNLPQNQTNSRRRSTRQHLVSQEALAVDEVDTLSHPSPCLYTPSTGCQTTHLQITNNLLVSNVPLVLIQTSSPGSKEQTLKEPGLNSASVSALIQPDKCHKFLLRCMSHIHSLRFQVEIH